MKKIVLLILSALIVIGFGACGTQKKVAEAKKQQKVEDQKIVTKQNKKIDSLIKVVTNLQSENQLQSKGAVENKKTATGLNKKIDSLVAINLSLQDENKKLQFDEAVSYGKVEFLYSYTDSLKKVIEGLTVGNQQSKNGQTIIQPKTRVLDSMTVVTYELKDSVWVKVTNGKSVKMPKKGEIGVSEDKTEIYIRGSDIDAISDEEIATWQFLNHKIMQVNK